MSHKPPKRLMPEVLPDPLQQAGAGNPRRRTVQRMQGLLALTAASAACSRTPPADGLPTSPPDKATAQNTSTSAPVQASSPPVIVPSARPPEPTGYAVVDPMPPPARCAGFSRTISVSSKWKDEHTLELTLSKSTMANASWDASRKPEVYPPNAKIEKSKLAATGGSFEILLPSEATSLSLMVGAICPEGKQRVSIGVTGAGGALGKDTKLLITTADLGW